MLGDVAAVMERLERDPNTVYEEEKKGLQLMPQRGYRALLSVPLVIREQDYGGITLYFRQTREFSQEEIQLATSVAVWRANCTTR